MALELWQPDSQILHSYDRALEIGNQGLLDHHRAEIFHNLGVLYARGLDGAKPDWENAKKLFTEAVRLQPELVEAHESLGLVAVQGGHHSEALKHYHKAIARG